MVRWLSVLLLLLLLLCTKAVTSAEPECHNFTKLPFTDTIIGTPLVVRLLLYTSKNTTCGQLINATHTRPLDVKKKTIFVIHGYRPFGSPPNWLAMVIETILDVDDVNLIIVDWNRGATTMVYSAAVANTKKVAAILEPVIHNILHNGGSLDLIHMIGVSLGAHISGFVGSRFDGKIGRITGLDPAGPLFTGKGVDDRLDPADAQLVDVLHTDIDALGYREFLGHIDYYANGGADQPGCPATILGGKRYMVCDHQRSVYLYVNSMNISRNITVYPCGSYAEFLDARCTRRDGTYPIFGYHLEKWRNSSSVMKFPNKVFFQTSPDEPFYMFYYLLDIVSWNKNPRKGYITIGLTGRDGTVVKSETNHHGKSFERFRETTLLVSVDKDPGDVTGISLTYSSSTLVEHKLTLGLLRVRLRSLTHPQRPHLCRYDVALERDEEVRVELFPCQQQEM
ncbi:LOW QUALITY PROTEIN: lipase member H-like [Leucoraja erinacea]|uniref:LOW QUALITY PROTEIN: lipase member H-like n=1 Tax=Leucoraja erinaceus TaxID=7782 RepID=UPI002454D332|nr:LOW QUALITY PROTEIN: lipase member H-like [Leucoraja erinacea]